MSGSNPVVIMPERAVVCDAHCLHDWHVEHLEYLLRLRRAVLAAKQAVRLPSTSVMPLLYSCRDLEVLWDSAGGNPDEAFTAAEISRAESGGDTLAVSPTDDVGLWQINKPSWGVLASTDPAVNVRSAITISDNGADWNPWTTYRTGAYEGEC
jgi:hypothetical protein